MLVAMVRLLMLVVAWVLMRRYMFRRRDRLYRESFARCMTDKLRKLARQELQRRKSAPKRQARPPVYPEPANNLR